MVRSIIATIRGGLTIISISFLFSLVFSLPLAENPSPYCWLFVGLGFWKLEFWFGYLWGLCMYVYEICIYEFWFWYLWVVCIFFSFICMFVSFICICLLHLCFLMKIDWFSAFWCSWIVFVDVCTWEISMFMSWVLRFGLASFFWCMGEREMKEEDDTFWEKWRRSED